MTFFWCKFDFGKCFGAISWSSCWAGHCQLSYKIQFLSHITICLINGLLSLHRIREDDTSKRWFFWFSVSSWGTHLSSFFTFPICFTRQMTIEWLTLSSSAISPVVIRGSASIMLSVGRCQLLMAGHYAPHCQSSCLHCKTSWTTTACMFISSSWAKCVVDVRSCHHCFTTHFEL